MADRSHFRNCFRFADHTRGTDATDDSSTANEPDHPSISLSEMRSTYPAEVSFSAQWTESIWIACPTGGQRCVQRQACCAALDPSIRGHPTTGLLAPVKIEGKPEQYHAEADRRSYRPVQPEVTGHRQPTN